MEEDECKRGVCDIYRECNPTKEHFMDRFNRAVAGPDFTDRMKQPYAYPSISNLCVPVVSLSLSLSFSSPMPTVV